MYFIMIKKRNKLPGIYTFKDDYIEFFQCFSVGYIEFFQLLSCYVNIIIG